MSKGMEFIGNLPLCGTQSKNFFENMEWLVHKMEVNVVQNNIGPHGFLLQLQVKGGCIAHTMN